LRGKPSPSPPPPTPLRSTPSTSRRAAAG
jgi:hypothetical protein